MKKVNVRSKISSSIAAILLAILAFFTLGLSVYFANMKTSADTTTVNSIDLFSVKGNDANSGSTTVTPTVSTVGNHTGVYVNTVNSTKTDKVVDQDRAYKWYATNLKGIFDLPTATNDTKTSTNVNFMFNVPQLSNDLTGQTPYTYSDQIVTGSFNLMLIGVIRVADAVDTTSFVDVYIAALKGEDGNRQLVAGAVYFKPEVYFPDSYHPNIFFRGLLFDAQIWDETKGQYDTTKNTKSGAIIVNNTDRDKASTYSTPAFSATNCSELSYSPTFSVKNNADGELAFWLTDTEGHEYRVISLTGERTGEFATFDETGTLNTAKGMMKHNGDGYQGASAKSPTPTASEVFKSGKYTLSFYSQSTSQNVAESKTYLNDELVVWRTSNRHTFSYSPLMVKSVKTTNAAGEVTGTTTFNGETVNTPAWYTAYMAEQDKSNTITYDLGGVTASNSNPTTVKLSDNSITLTDPTNIAAGYEFDGWYADGAYTTKITKVMTDTSKTAQTIYAKFKKTYEIQEVSYAEMHLLSEAFTLLPATYQDMTTGETHDVELIEILNSNGDFVNLSADNKFSEAGTYTIRYTAEEDSDAVGNTKEYQVLVAEEIFDKGKLFNSASATFTHGHTSSAIENGETAGLLISSESEFYNMKVNGVFLTSDEVSWRMRTVNAWPEGIGNGQKAVVATIKISAKDGSDCFYLVITDFSYVGGVQTLHVVWNDAKYNQKSGKTTDNTLVRNSADWYNSKTGLGTCYEGWGTNNHCYDNAIGPQGHQARTYQISLKTVDGVFGVYVTRRFNNGTTYRDEAERLWVAFDGTYDLSDGEVANKFGAETYAETVDEKNVRRAKYGLPKISDILGDDGYTIEFMSGTGPAFTGAAATDYRDLFISNFNAVSLDKRYTGDAAPNWYTTYLNSFAPVNYVIANTTSNGNATVLTSGQTATLVNPVMKTGYTFEGWYSDSAYTTVITSIAFAQGGVTVYGKVSPTNYSITYTVDGDSWTPESMSSYTVETSGLLPVPTKVGHIFTGWINGEDTIVKLTAGSTGDLNLVAQFAEDTLPKEIDWTTTGGTYTFARIDGLTINYSLTKGGTAIDLNGAAAYNFTEAGEYTLTYTIVIGDLTQDLTATVNVVAINGGAWAGKNVSLTDDIILKYYVTLNEGYSNPTAKFVFKDTETEVNGESQDGQYVFAFSGVRFPEMHLLVSVYVSATNGEGESVVILSKENDSVKDYLETVLRTEGSSTELKTLIVDLMNLATQVQIKYEAAETEYINKDLTEAEKALATTFVEPTENLMSLPTGANDVTFKAARIIFNEKIAVGVAFATDKNVANLTAKVKIYNGETVVSTFDSASGDIVAITMDDVTNAYELRFTTVMPYMFGYKIEVEIFEDNTSVSGKFTYSVNDYVRRNSENELAKKLWAYGVSAKAYKESLLTEQN